MRTAEEWKEVLQESVIKAANGCWVWTKCTDLKGYPYCSKGLVHRLAYKLYKEDIPSEICVCHRCDNPLCINPDHMFLGSRADNNRDRQEKGRGRYLYGEDHPSHKLTWEQVQEIRKSTETSRALGKRFGVTHSGILAIKRGAKWKEENCGKS